MPKKKLPPCLPQQPAQVIRFSDYEKRSRNPDAAGPRDPCEADVIVMPVVRIERDDDAPSECPCM